MNINELIVEAYTNSAEHGFWEGVDKNTCIPEKLMLMVSELSEALEHYRNGNHSEPITNYWYDGNISKPDGFSVELADVVIRVADLCGKLGIDLEEVIRVKMAYNRSRPYKHGKVC